MLILLLYLEEKAGGTVFAPVEYWQYPNPDTYIIDMSSSLEISYEYQLECVSIDTITTKSSIKTYELFAIMLNLSCTDNMDAIHLSWSQQYSPDFDVDAYIITPYVDTIAQTDISVFSGSFDYADYVTANIVDSTQRTVYYTIKGIKNSIEIMSGTSNEEYVTRMDPFQ